LDHEYSSNDNIMSPQLLQKTLKKFDLMINENAATHGELLR
jgi:hypothetical protein